MLTNTLSFVARVGAIVLLVLLCRSQAQPLIAAAFAGDLPALGWVILVYLIHRYGLCAGSSAERIPHRLVPDLQCG